MYPMTLSVMPEGQVLQEEKEKENEDHTTTND